MAPIVSPARTGPVWRHLLVPSGVLLVIACYEYCLVQADVVGEGGCGGVGRVSSSSLWSCSCSWPRSCSGARGIAATNAYGSEMACFAYVSNGVVERSGSTVAFVFVLYAPPVPFMCALRIAAVAARASLHEWCKGCHRGSRAASRSCWLKTYVRVHEAHVHYIHTWTVHSLMSCVH